MAIRAGIKRVQESGEWRPTLHVLFCCWRDREKIGPSEERHEVKESLFFSGWNKPKHVPWVKGKHPHKRCKWVQCKESVRKAILGIEEWQRQKATELLVIRP